jgi:hypothetical protein
MAGPSIQAQVSPNDEPMLERKLAYPDSITHLPYTNLCFISNAELPNISGWILDDEIKKSTNRSLLIIEMNSSEVWGYKYSSGSVQFVIDVSKFKESYQFDIGSDEIKVHLINNYGDFGGSDDPLIGGLSLTRINDKIKVIGKVTIATSNPYTKQVVEFNDDLIPEYDLNEFLIKAKESELKIETDRGKMVEVLTKSMLEDTCSIAEEQIEQNNQVKEKRIPGQGFKLTHSIYGLGSGRGHPSRIIVKVQDSILTYGIMEISREVGYISFSTGDTTWKKKRVWYDISFSTESRDSILTLLEGKQGQYIFHTNPYIMSGAIKQIYVEYEGWCIDFCLKNAFNETSNNIAGILNPYLPKDYKLYVGVKDDWYENQNEPLIKECSGSADKSYIDILGDEFESIRKQKTEPNKK